MPGIAARGFFMRMPETVIARFSYFGYSRNMEIDAHVETLSALAHPGRLAVVRLLARRAPHGIRAGEIAAALGMKPNTLSGYLATLARSGLVQSERVGVSIIYAIDLGSTGRLIDYLVMDCCNGRPELCAPLAAHALKTLDGRNQAVSGHADRAFNVLFICAENSARSIFAEAILAREGGDSFNVFSAGPAPALEPHPYATTLLQTFGYPTETLRAKSVSAYQQDDAPEMDFVFTLCDRAARAGCAPWAGQPIAAHWELLDPVMVQGTEAEKRRAFMDAFQALRHRLREFMALPVADLDRTSLQKALDAIGAENIRAETGAY